MSNDEDTCDPWPPVPPDVVYDSIELEKPALSVTPNSQIYRIKGDPSKVFKAKGMVREYELQKAAGDCAMSVHGKVFDKSELTGRLEVILYGYIMDLGTPLPKTEVLSPSQRRDLMYQMIQVLQQLHDKEIIHGDIKLENVLLDDQGKVRFCDFAEGRYVSEDETLWEGATTWHYESPNRRIRGEESGCYPPPPIFEDDLYGLGLSIWQLYTGKVPNEDVAGDDLGMREMQLKGETVDVAEVEDLEAREILTELLRKGGARI